MAIIITDECINCGACEPECPNTAIYEAAVNWKYSDGTSLRGEVNLLDGKIVSAEVPQGRLMTRFIILSQISVLSVKDFMKSLNVLLYALLIVVFLT